jgi:hypothetical protein
MPTREDADMASEFTIALGGRTYEIEFTPSILKESQAALGRPIISAIRDDRGWRGFTYEEIEALLFVQIRRQRKGILRQKVNDLLEAHLLAGHPLQEVSLVFMQAFNACGLEYRLTRDDEDGEATAAPPGRPSLALVETKGEPVAAGTSESPEA